ncbi:hypothetical protein EJ110_NYTH50887 [Nymphaea thermarum]|nr:hypothetical protein EJ110_NYTH50887 [Nymphaea thermarum]
MAGSAAGFCPLHPSIRSLRSFKVKDCALQQSPSKLKGVHGCLLGEGNWRFQFRPSRHLVARVPGHKCTKRNGFSSLSIVSEGMISGDPDSNEYAGTENGRILEENGSRGEMGLERSELCGGKSGAVSFCGLTHKVIDKQKTVSSSSQKNIGSFVWFIGPASLIASLLLPQFFLNNFILAFTSNEIVADIIYLISSEIIFYVGLATFLAITDYVRRPYLLYNSQRWSLITSVKGWLHSSIITMGLKMWVPILAVYVVWPVVGLPALVAMAPFLLGCAAQFVFETLLDVCGSSSWPLVPIIFEMYRLYQLSRAAQFIERLILFARRSAASQDLFDKGNTLVSLLVVLQILGVVCLWSLTTFLVRLFPSRPVEKI